VFETADIGLLMTDSWKRHFTQTEGADKLSEFRARLRRLNSMHFESLILLLLRQGYCKPPGLKSDTSAKLVKTVQASSMLRSAVRRSGLQFDTTINAWHTCPRSGRITASNPCSEYMFLDDSACNLASLNLLRFVAGEAFDVALFQHAVRVLIIAQDILTGKSLLGSDESLALVVTGSGRRE
jgi:hypothetical protein